MNGRIYFEGNPWAEGHALKELLWWAVVQPDRGLSFSLHLRSANYYAERDLAKAEGGEPRSSWQSPSVWANYHGCTLGSTYEWLVGTDDKPLSFDGLDGHTLAVDEPGSAGFDLEDDDTHSFEAYVLGHDSVADHRLRFDRASDGASWKLSWTGRIALSSGGDYELSHRFRAEASGLVFGGFEIPGNTSEADGVALVKRWCRDPGDLVLAPKSQTDGLRCLRSAA